MHTIVNPGSEEYKSFSLDDRNIFGFTSKLGIAAATHLQEDTIETDDSILPFQEIVSEKVIRSPELFTSYSF